MITGINQSKTLTKHIQCKCKGKFDGRKFTSGQWWNKNKQDVGVKNVMYIKKTIFGILLDVVEKWKRPNKFYG